MEETGTPSSFKGFLKANRTFFVLVGLILLSVFGYFWYKSGFTLDYNKFFASCSEGDCDDDGYNNPSVRGDDCDDGNPSIGGSPSCRACQLPGIAGGLTCSDGDCDDDGHDNPSVGGDDCDDANWCNNGGGCGPPPTSTPPPPTPTPSSASCNPTFRSCNGNSLFQHYSNCSGQNVQNCSPGTCIDPDGAGTSQDAYCQGAATTTPIPTGGGTNPCAGASDVWTDDGVTVCLLSSNFAGDRCTLQPPGALHYTVGIVNNSGHDIYSRSVLFYCPSRPPREFCGALDNHSYPGCGFTGADVSGATRVLNGQSNAGNLTTYRFDPPGCGSFQLDDTWGGGNGTFVIGKVIETGTNCSTPTPVTPPPTTITPPPTTITPPPTTITPPPTTITPPPTALRCVGMVTQVNVGQSAPFSASGGTGSYTWYAPNGTPATAGGASFSVSYAVPGFKTITVVSGGEQATCPLTVLAPQTSVPPTALVCRPPSQDVSSGQPATVTVTGGTPNYTWSAVGGNPSAQRDGTSFTATFNTTQPNQVFPIIVTDAAGLTATCNVNVSCPIAECPAPPDGCTYQSGNRCSCGTLVCPSNAPLVCAPQSQTVSVGQQANFTAGGGTSRTFSWSAPNGTPSSAAGPSQNFAASYNTPGAYLVTVTSGSQSATCTVTVSAVPTTITPPPTAPALSMQKTVRNITQNGTEGESVPANPSDTVEFIVRVSSGGTGPALDVTVRDTLPSGLTYQPGTTTIDSVAAADGIIGSGLNLGTMNPGRTIIVRFRATVATAAFFSIGTTTLVNTAYAQGSNVPSVSDTAFVSVVRNPGSPTMSLTKMGRNTSRGQTGEHSPVNASPTETVEFIIRVRNTSAAPLTNVQVRDIVPQGITFIAGSARLNNQAIPDTIATSGYGIGNLSVGQEVVITFSGRIAAANALPGGTTTLINTVQATADNVPMLTAQLPVVITNSAPVSQVPTGPGESTLLALIVSAIITLLYVGYTSTDTFRRREAGQIASQSKGDKGLFDFRS